MNNRWCEVCMCTLHTIHVCVCVWGGLQLVVILALPNIRITNNHMSLSSSDFLSSCQIAGILQRSVTPLDLNLHVS